MSDERDTLIPPGFTRCLVCGEYRCSPWRGTLTVTAAPRDGLPSSHLSRTTFIGRHLVLTKGSWLDRMWNAEELRRSGAYHEAAHAVADVVLDHTVRYVSIETEGTDYRDTCVTAVNHMEFPGLGLIPEPWQALGHAIATIAGNMAMAREVAKPYPWETWEAILSDCEDIEALGDPDEAENDTTMIREYCEAAAHLGQFATVPAPDELPEGAPPLPRIPSTGEEAFEMALREAEPLVDAYWGEITAVAEKLMEVGYLSGEEVEEIVFGFDASGEGRT
jgi:hypothetical protein